MTDDSTMVRYEGQCDHCRTGLTLYLKDYAPVYIDANKNPYVFHLDCLACRTEMHMVRVDER